MARGGRRSGAGRPKGARNKVSVTSRDELWAYIEQQCAAGHAANPLQVLVDTMVSVPAERVTCALALADRLLPKLKAVEHTGTGSGPQTVFNIQVIQYGGELPSPHDDQPHPPVAVSSPQLSAPTLRRFGTGHDAPRDGVAP